MAPLYDTDVAENRWSDSQWQNVEFWEKLSKQHNRRRRIWIYWAVVLFFSILALGVTREYRPRWKAVSVSRNLAEEISVLKRSASIDHFSYRIRIEETPVLSFWVERMESCRSPTGVMVYGGLLYPGGIDGVPLMLLNGARAEQMGLPNVFSNEFCYDYQEGHHYSAWKDNQGNSVSSFGFAPAKDLTEVRRDRVSTVIVKGDSAEVWFD